MKFTPRAITTLMGAGALILATTAITNAQETIPDHAAQKAQNQPQSRQGNPTTPGATSQTSGAAHRYGPGDATGTQRVGPQDGTGKGARGATGPGAKGGQNATPNAKQTRAEKKAQKKAAQKAKKQAKQHAAESTWSARYGTTGTRTRARDLSGVSSGRCTGTGQQRRQGGSGGGRN